MIPKSAKIVGTGATVALSTAVPTGGFAPPNRRACKVLQLIIPASSTGFTITDANGSYEAGALIGGTEVAYSASPYSRVGFPLPLSWSGQMLPPIAELTEFYDLSTIYVYLAVGDVLELLYA
jgi:hypothetical protein